MSFSRHAELQRAHTSHGRSRSLLEVAFALSVALAGALTFGACSSERPALGTDEVPAEATTHEPADAAPPPLTWYGRAKPIIEARCMSCHDDGGIAPFALNGFDEVKGLSTLVRSAVEARTMPPMPADDRNCQPLSDARQMLDEEREDLLSWIDEGMPKGSSKDAPVDKLPSLVSEPPLEDATSRAASGQSYARKGTITDDYRCIIVDPAWTRATVLKAIGVEPGNASIVHHVIVYAQLPEDAAEVDALDAADPEPGYECFGDAGFSGARAVASYVPGAAPRAFPGGATLTAPPGTRFIMQMHYNFLTGDGEAESTLSFWQVPESSGVRVHGLVMINTKFMIPAGMDDFSATGTSQVVAAGSLMETSSGGGVRERQQTEPGLAWGVSAHMHLHGQSARVELIRTDGSEECLLDIPKWDFDWQGEYRFREPVQLNEGDNVRLTCRWDNSADNQPMLNGEQLTPADLAWGSGSLEEMCLGTLKMTPP